MSALRELIRNSGDLANRRISGPNFDVGLDVVLSRPWIDSSIDQLRGRSILIATKDQFATACALIDCDCVARRMTICPPGVSPEHLATLAAVAEVDAVLCDDAAIDNPLPAIEGFSVRPASAQVDTGVVATIPAPAKAQPDEQVTEWVLATSGTSGAPKLVVHTHATLLGAISGGNLGRGSVWSTFYDIRRFGGLQIFLRALVGGGSLILSSSGESVAAFLARAVRYGVTHISGTPSHWRRALMSPSCFDFTPNYIRLSGEIVDQSILDRLRAVFDNADISHAFASTEAGVAFDVVDGLAGFPATFIGDETEVAMRVKDGSLRIKSDRTALRYLGEASPPLAEPDGFIDTGDMVELHQDRYVFVGRRTGIINVGGLKIHPEEVEAVILEHPRVRMCVVRERRNPITGAIVTAEVVTDRPETDLETVTALKEEIATLCRHRLARHKVPASIRLVPSLDIAVSGKTRR